MNRNAICIEKVTVLYDSHVALNDVTISICENDYVGIIGPNGGGKTTLIKAILGLIKPASGKIEIYGNSIEHSEQIIAYVPQIGTDDRTFPMTVIDLVLLGLLPKKVKLFHTYSKKDYLKAKDALEQVGITHLSKRRISQMSGGEYQKALIAHALVQNPKILLLDEPTANIDQKSRSEIYELLHHLNSKMTIVMVTHDTLAISSYVKNVACLDQNLIYHGVPELIGDAIERMYNCPIDLITHGNIPHRVLKEHEGGDEHD